MLSSQLSLKGKSSPCVIDMGHGDPGQNKPKISQQISDLVRNNTYIYLLSPHASTWERTEKTTKAEHKEITSYIKYHPINRKSEAYPVCILHTIYRVFKFIVHLDFLKMSFS